MDYLFQRSTATRNDSQPPPSKSNKKLLNMLKEEAPQSTQEQLDSEKTLRDSHSKIDLSRVKSNSKMGHQQNKSAAGRFDGYVDSKNQKDLQQAARPSQVHSKAHYNSKQTNKSHQNEQSRGAIDTDRDPTKPHVFMKLSQVKTDEKAFLGKDKHDTLEDEYSKYLMGPREDYFHNNNNNQSNTTVHQLIDGAHPPDIEVALYHYNQAVKEQLRETINNAATPTAKFTNFVDEASAAKIRMHSPRTLRQKEQAQAKQPQLNRELTYESERSSIFNENVNVMDGTVNRNRLPMQIGNRLEDQKRITREGSIVCNGQLDSHRSDGGTIQQFLELNMRMSNVTTLNDKVFSKNQFLRTVDLRNNSLALLPDSICDLKILWKLRVDNNLLTHLPQNLGQLERLEVLTASHNKIAALPQSLFTLGEKLSMLQLNDNCLTRISRDVGLLNKLRVLLLHNNELCRVPYELKSLSTLNEFSLDWFQYLQPQMNKILKEERGQLVIKDFQKFCKTISEVDSSQQCQFVHFVSHFHKLVDLDQIQNLTVYPKQRSIVHYLCLHGHHYLLKDMMRQIPALEINHADIDGTTPLALAFKNKQSAVIKFLMKYPITNFNKGSSKYGYPLHIGIKSHDFSLVWQMLKPKYVVNINARDEEGNTALHFIMGHFGFDADHATKITSVLLKKGIEVNLLNKVELGPLHIAIKNYQNKALRFALEYNQYVRRHQKYVVKRKSSFEVRPNNASSSNPFQTRASLTAFDFNMKGKNEWTPLHYAVYNNNLIAVELLLHAQKFEKIDFYQRDADGKLPQDLSPFNSPIYKMIIKKQKQVFTSKIGQAVRVPIQEEQIQHHCISKKVMLSQQFRDDELHQTARYGLLRRVNSNGQLWKPPNSLYQKHSQLGRGVRLHGAKASHNMSLNESDTGGGMDDSLTIEEQQYNLRKQHGVRLGGLASSKTEKNLHSDPSVLMNVLGRNKMDQKEAPQFRHLTKQSYKQSPRIFQAMSPLQPKALLHSEEGQENIEIEELIQLELGQTSFRNKDGFHRYLSNFVNFSSEEEGGANGDTVSQVRSDSVSSASSYIDSHSNYFTVDKKDVKEMTKVLGGEAFKDSKVFEFKQEQYLQQLYQSAPSKDHTSPVKPKDLDTSQLRMSTQNNDDDDDFCCAEDEDAEAGALGMIANKINKFENYNNVPDTEYKHIQEKGALKRIVGQLSQQKTKRRLLRMKAEQQKKKTPVRHRNCVSSDRFIQTPIHERIFEQIEESPLEMKFQRHNQDEGNVFDTVDHSDDMSTPKIAFDNDRRQLRNIMERPSIFVSEYKIETSGCGESEIYSNVKRRDEALGSIQGGGLCRLRDLNRDCKLGDTQQVISEQINQFLNDPSKSLSQKYQKLYSYIYHQGQIIDEQRLKAIFDNLDSRENQIIKADLSYLISLSKNKEFIPALDHVITSMKEKEQQEYEYRQATNEGVLQEAQVKTLPSVVMPSDKDSKSAGQDTGKSHHKQLKSQSNCKSLIIYETTNAFETLMQEAMLQTRQMMDAYNQRIGMERERSREKVKHNKSYANVSAYQYKHSSSLKKLNEETMLIQGSSVQKPVQLRMKDSREPGNSIRDVPELVARLNKSPSTKQFHSKRRYDVDLSDDMPPYMMQGGAIVESANYPFKKKTSFTPKGSSGQVFLAFQRQKQTRDYLVAKAPNEEAKSGYPNNVAIINLQEENYNETLINLQMPKNSECDNSKSMVSKADREVVSVKSEDKQKLKLDLYIQKRKEELRKQQQQVTRQKDLNLQKKRSAMETSLYSAKAKQASLKKTQMIQQKQSPGKNPMEQADDSMEEKLRKNLMILNHQQSYLKSRKKSELTGSGMAQALSKQMQYLKNSNSSTQSQMMKKSTSTSKLTLESSYLYS